MKVVLDTNVYVSAALSGRKSEEIFQLAIVGKIDLVVSPSILGELSDKLESKFNWSEKQIRFLLETIKMVVEIVEPEEVIHAVEEDPDDDKVLECAVASSVDVIVSGDKHLLKMDEYRGITIISPAEFLSSLE